MTYQPDNADTYLVDLSILTPSLILPEALLSQQQCKYKHTVINLLAECLKRPSLLGVPLLPIIKETQDKKSLMKILKETPLGNPCWCLFGMDLVRAQDLQDDLASFTLKINEKENNQSLKSMIKSFIREKPQYGNAAEVAKQRGCSQKDIFTEWSSYWTLFSCGKKTTNLSDVTTNLILLQLASAPQTKKQILLAHPERPVDEVIVTPYPVYRPDSPYYAIALRQLLASSVTISQEAFDEMVELHSSLSLTNFLPFAPLLLQPFAHSNMNLPTPSINNLATMMGAFASGATSTFVGNIKGRQPSWHKLSFSLVKLCVEVESPLADVELTDEESDFEKIVLGHAGARSRYRIKTKYEDLTENPTFGEDIGTFLIHNDLLQKNTLSLKEIRNSVKLNFHNFPKKDESNVFTSGQMRVWLDGWMKKQCKKTVARLLLGEKGEWCNNHPPTLELLNNHYTLMPRFTAFVRKQSFKGLLSSGVTERKPTASSILGKAHGVSDHLHCLKESRPTASSILGEAYVVTDMQTHCMGVASDGENDKFFIAEPHKGEVRKKQRVRDLRKHLREEKKEREELERQALGLTEREAIIFRCRYWMDECDTMAGKPKCEQEKIICKFDDVFLKLFKYDLNLVVPNIIGVKSRKEICEWYQQEFQKQAFSSPKYYARNPRHFKWHFGDEELAAVNAYQKALEQSSWEDETKMTKAPLMVMKALSFLNEAKRAKDRGVINTFEVSGDHSSFPLTGYDDSSVFSLLAYLYWTEFLKERVPFRVRKPDEEALFLPTARIRQTQHDLGVMTRGDETEYLLDPFKKKKKNLKKGELENVSVSKQSLINIENWKPENILRDVCSFFNLKQDKLLDYHPSKTINVRFYLQSGVDMMDKRLSNRNLASYLSFISDYKKSPDDYWNLFLEKKKELTEWYENLMSQFRGLWMEFGDEFFSIIDEGDGESKTSPMV